MSPQLPCELPRPICAAFDQGHPPAGSHQEIGTRRADDAAADHDHVARSRVRCHGRMPIAKGSAGSINQGGLGIDVRRPADSGPDAALDDPHRALEDAADDAFLPPDFSLAELAVGAQAGELGTGAGAARRAIVGLARAKHEVLAVGAWHAGGAK